MIILGLELFAVWLLFEVPIVLVAAGIMGDGEFSYG